MKRVGILYDNISRNIGDLAIGISIRKIFKIIGLAQKNYSELVPGLSDTKKYKHIIIGGGLLLRPKGDFFYDKFRVEGPHILNCMGIFKKPQDLKYLNNYSYVSVRSHGDKNKLSYLKTPIHVVPCTSLLLEDRLIRIHIGHPAIGIHFFKALPQKTIIQLVHWLTPNFYVYFLPITHYNYDYEYQDAICKKISSSRCLALPRLSPLGVYSIIGLFNAFVSCSLHGAMFAYAHNIPFILWNNPNDDKMRNFMNDRLLERYLFTKDTIKKRLEILLNKPPNYKDSLKKDKEAINRHIKTIGAIIG